MSILSIPTSFPGYIYVIAGFVLVAIAIALAVIPRGHKEITEEDTVNPVKQSGLSTEVATCRYCGEPVTSQTHYCPARQQNYDRGSDDSFLVSMFVAGATNSAGEGVLLGGNPVGALLGDALNTAEDAGVNNDNGGNTNDKVEDPTPDPEPAADSEPPSEPQPDDTYQSDSTDNGSIGVD